MLKIFIIVALVKLLDATNKPFLCSGLYAVIVFSLGLLVGGAPTEVIIGTAISFGTASIYFWLLNRVEDSLFWWIILVMGLPIALI